jgi:hypothetical protein
MIRPKAMRRRLVRPWLLLASTVAWMTLVIVALSACAGGWRPVATVTVVTVGGGLAVAQGEHQRVYARATDTLRERLVASGGTLADYDREVAPINAAFYARGEAIQALDAQLYAGAAVIEASRGSDPRQWARAAQRILAAIRRHLAVLEDGAILPAVRIPQEIHDAVRVLEQLAPLAGVVVAGEVSDGR